MHRKYLFRRTPAERLADWQRTRSPWTWIFAICVFLLALSHFVFEKWLLMPPCEQCVYIRFAFFTMALGALFPIVFPRSAVMRLIGYAQGIAASIYGIHASWTLITIHRALHSNDPTALFSVKGCSLTPHYPFDLPMAQWFPQLFQPSGPCGVDLPVVMPGTELGAWQADIIGFINEAGGWYLIPPLEAGTMAECAFLAFSVALFWYFAMGLAGLFTEKPL